MQLSDIRKELIALENDNSHYLLKQDKIEIVGEYSKIYTYLSESLSLNNVNDINIDYFDIFDSFLDFKYKKLKGCSFNTKLEKMPNSTVLEKIIKNSYRVAIIIRNAKQHHITINKDSKYLIIDNKERNCYLRILIQSEVLLKRLLLNYCYLLICGYSDRYCEEILTKIYNDFIIGIEVLRYNKETFHYKNFSENIFNASRRFLLCDCNYFLDDDKNLNINIANTFINNKDYPINLCIKLNKSVFIYPIELLKENKKIEKDELEKFIFKGETCKI